MSRRHHAIVALLSLPAVAALSAGCSDPEKAPTQVIFTGQLERAADTNCQDTGTLFDVGDFGNPAGEPPVPTNPIKDGQAWDQGTVSVSCSVTPAGAGEFNVAGSLVLDGATGGTFRIDGTFKTTGEQTGIHAIFAKRLGGNAYEQKDRTCVVRYTTQYQGVAAGRVWGEITCPNAENSSAQTTCKAVAEFKFENCDQ